MLAGKLILSFHTALLLACAATSLAGDRVTFTTIDGRTFRDVEITQIKGRKLEVKTPAGPQIVRFANLPADIQARYFDPSLRFPPKVGDLLEFTTLNGHAYKGPLREVAPNGISIETPDGLEKIAYSNLPPELANTFDYDAEDAALYEAALRAQRQRALAAQQAAAKKAAEQQKAAAQRNAPRPQPAPARAESQIGDRGSKSLGSPQLGGRGLGN